MMAHDAGDQPICLSRAELRDVARQGARDALAEIGLHDEQAAGDVRDLRSLLKAWQAAKTTAWHTIVKTVTVTALSLLIIGAAVKLKILGGP